MLVHERTFPRIGDYRCGRLSASNGWFLGFSFPIHVFSRHELRLFVHCVFLDQSRDGEWGGEQEVRALANVIQLPITVMRRAGDLVYEPTRGGRQGWLQSFLPLRSNQGQERVILSYHSSRELASHYQCLSQRPSDESSSPGPSRMTMNDSNSK